MVLNIINSNFWLVKSWQKSPKPIGTSVLFVPFWSHSNPHTKTQLDWFKRLTQLNNQLYIRRETYRILVIYMMHEMVCMWVWATLLFSLEHIRVNWLRDHTSWAKVELEWRLKVFPSTSNLCYWISPHQDIISCSYILKFT